ncbi:hypothetical protein AAY473_007628, partial [Plecturocebus cupreus]
MVPSQLSATSASQVQAVSLPLHPRNGVSPRWPPVLKLLTSGDLPTWASQSPGITDVSHLTHPKLWLQIHRNTFEKTIVTFAILNTKELSLVAQTVVQTGFSYVGQAGLATCLCFPKGWDYGRWSAMAQSQLTAASTSQVQVILRSQPP